MANILVEPTFYTKKYNPIEVVRIADRHQQYLYLKHGAYPVDMYVSIDTEELVMVFDKESTKELYEKYRKYELD